MGLQCLCCVTESSVSAATLSMALSDVSLICVSHRRRDFNAVSLVSGEEGRAIYVWRERTLAGVRFWRITAFLGWFRSSLSFGLEADTCFLDVICLLCLL